LSSRNSARDWLSLFLEYAPMHPRAKRDPTHAQAFLDPTKKQKDQDNHNDEPESAAWPVTPVSAIRPAWYCANQKKNQNYQQD